MFRFQHFSIQQDQCAMKVGTDGILLGAWAPLSMAGLAPRILDVGTGTGLVALMLAQRLCQLTSRFSVDALEIVEAAAKQAQSNVEKSPWQSYVRVIQGSLQNFDAEPYDMWVCNPPFFDGIQKKSQNSARAQARHDHTLDAVTFFSKAATGLVEHGVLCLVLPVDRLAHYEKVAVSKGFYLCQKDSVQHSVEHPIKRVLLLFKKQKPLQLAQKTWILKKKSSQTKSETWQDTPEFRQLVGNFYLRFARGIEL